MKIKVSDLRATVDYLEKEKVLDVEVVTSQGSALANICIDFHFVDADGAECAIKCYQTELGNLRRLVKNMVHGKKGKK